MKLVRILGGLLIVTNLSVGCGRALTKDKDEGNDLSNQLSTKVSQANANSTYLQETYKINLVAASLIAPTSYDWSKLSADDLAIVRTRLNQEVEIINRQHEIGANKNVKITYDNGVGELYREGALAYLKSLSDWESKPKT